MLLRTSVVFLTICLKSHLVQAVSCGQQLSWGEIITVPKDQKGNYKNNLHCTFQDKFVADIEPNVLQPTFLVCFRHLRGNAWLWYRLPGNLCGVRCERYRLNSSNSVKWSLLSKNFVVTHVTQVVARLCVIQHGHWIAFRGITPHSQ